MTKQATFNLASHPKLSAPAKYLMIFGLLATSNLALAVDPFVTNPTWVNVYWVPHGGDWDTLVGAASRAASGTSSDTACANAGEQPGCTGTMTVENLDSLLRAAVSSAVMNDLKDWGVTLNPVSLPGVVVDDCGDPGDVINDLAAGNPSPWSVFVDCAISKHASLQKVTNNGQDDLSLIVNVFLPPKVGTKDPSTDMCLENTDARKSAVDSSHGGAGGISLLPTNTNCSASLGQLFHYMTHESIESAFISNLCDWCSDFPFLSEIGPSSQALPFNMYAKAADYSSCQPGACFCAPAAAEAKALKNATLAICGSGANMVFQADVDPRNAPPWDVPLAKGIDSSLYTKVVVDARARGGTLWSFGGLHEMPSGSVVANPVTWTQANPTADAFVQIAGFKTNYQAGSIEPGDVVQFQIFDPVWGQPNPGAQITVPSPGTGQIVNLGTNLAITGAPHYYSNWVISGDTVTFQGQLVTQNCGLATHTVAATGFQSVQIVASSDGSGDIVSATTTDALGNFTITDVVGLAGTRTIKVGVASNLNMATFKVDVHPWLQQIVPALGAGNQVVALNGTGFQNTLANPFSVTFGTVPPGLAAIGLVGATGASASITTPLFPACPNPRLATSTVDVTATVGAFASGPVQYTYVIPRVPVMTFAPVNCGSPWVQVLVYDATDKLLSCPAGNPPIDCWVTLSTTYPALSNGTANQIKVLSGTQVPYFGSGVFTATGTGGASCPATSPPYSYCLPPSIFYVQYPKWPGDARPPNPPPWNSSFWGSSLVWSDPSPVGDTFTISGSNPSIQQQISIRGLSLAEFRAQLAINPYAIIVSGASDTAAFLGDAVKVSMGTSTSLPYPAVLSFKAPAQLPAGTAFHVVRLSSLSLGGVWQDVVLQSAPSGYVQTTIQAPGLYALATTTHQAVSMSAFSPLLLWADATP